MVLGKQKDRMLSQGWYLDEPDLVEDRRRCWRMLDRYNATGADDDAQRYAILKDLLGEVGAGTQVMPRFWCSYGRHIRLGRDVFINTDALLMDDAPISIGDGTRMGPRAQLLTALHPVDDHDARRAGWERPAPVTVGSNVWLGSGVIVCPGVSIGDDAVIGAGSVVTRGVTSRVLVAGNPARTIREL